MTQNYSPENPRSVHGGEDSHLAVEVIPVLQDSEGCRAMPHAPQLANKFSVYIRNPLALHIIEFAKAPGWPERQRAEAFTFADALAEHLGCVVVSAIARPKAAPAVPDAISTSDLVEAGACLWEAVLDLKGDADGDDNPISIAFEQNGTANIRAEIVAMAEHLHRDWVSAVSLNGYDSPFDWEFCPSWLLLNVTFDRNGAHMAEIRTLPTDGRAAPAEPENPYSFPYAGCHDAGCEALGRGSGVPYCIAALADHIERVAGDATDGMIAALGNVLLDYRAAAKG